MCGKNRREPTSPTYTVKALVKEVVDVRCPVLLIDDVGSHKSVRFEEGGFLVRPIFFVVRGPCVTRRFTQQSHGGAANHGCVEQTKPHVHNWKVVQALEVQVFWVGMIRPSGNSNTSTSSVKFQVE